MLLECFRRNYHLPADHPSTPQREYVLDLKQSTRPVTSDDVQMASAAAQEGALAFTDYYVMQNGHPCIPVMGEFHASRFPRQYWQDELRKMRAGGVTIVASYVLWIHVEEEEGIFDWSGDRDIRAFIEACQAAGLQMLLRIGPFAHGECRNGGLPDWLYGRAIPVRSNDERYLFYVRRYFGEIAKQVEGLLYKDSGPVVGIQIENEYMHAGAPWEVTYKQGREWVPAGSDGVEHLQLLKQLAIEAGLQVPFYSCTGWGGSPVPDSGFFPMQSAYAFTPWILDPEFQQGPTREFLFRDRHAQSAPGEEITYDLTRFPYAYCEMGGGIQITYNHRPVVPPECVQAMAIVALGSGTNWLGYYMYHGGSNPVGKRSYLNEFTAPRISYDFQAPIREYGQLNQSYHYLRALHLFLQEFGETLAPMTVTLPEDSEQITAENTSSLRYAARSKDGSGFLFLNNYQDHAATQDHEGIHLCLELPGESLLLPQGEGLALRKHVSAILPFNLRLAGGVLLKYATAQALTKLNIPEQTTYIFFAPDGMRAEFCLDRSTYRSIEVSGGILKDEREQGYIMVEPGLQCRVDITTLDGTHLRLLVLTQEQAHSCWKVDLWGQERLILSEALVLCKNHDLHLYWPGQESILLAVYPSLPEGVISNADLLVESGEGFFRRYRLSVAERNIALNIQRSSPDTIRIEVPATALDGVHDAFLCIDYLGDIGSAYLDGSLVSDHFANGSPWEIGLKRFMVPGTDRELIVRISPLQQDATMLRYFPHNVALQPASDGTFQVEVHSITVVPEYHTALTQHR
jgi:beta-galactosidase